MTIMNYPHEAASSRDAAPSPASLPTVEWSPLDEIIQTWADFAHVTRSAAGLCAVSAAFAALAAESAARATAIEVGLRESAGLILPRKRRRAALPDSVFTDLNEARLRWLEALWSLGRVRAVQDEEAAPLLANAGEQAACQAQHLLHLSLRLLRETGVDPSRYLRVYITFPLPDEEENEQEQVEGRQS